MLRLERVNGRTAREAVVAVKDNEGDKLFNPCRVLRGLAVMARSVSGW